MKVNRQNKIEFFESLIEKVLFRCSTDRPYVKIKVTYWKEYQSEGVIFKIKFNSFAVPEYVMEKFKKEAKTILNGKMYNEYEYDRITKKNYERTFFLLHSLKLTKTHQHMIGAFYEYSNVKDFFNL